MYTQFNIGFYLIEQSPQSLQLRLELPVVFLEDLHARLQTALMLSQQTGFSHHVLKVIGVVQIFAWFLS